MVNALVVTNCEKIICVCLDRLCNVHKLLTYYTTSVMYELYQMTALKEIKQNDCLYLESQFVRDHDEWKCRLLQYTHTD